MYLRKPTMEEIRRRREREAEMFRLVRTGTPEAMARWRELLDEIGHEREEREREIENHELLLRKAEGQRMHSQQVALEQVQKSQILLRDGDIRTSNLYRKSQVICDLTVLFCSRYVTDYHDRTKDQMIQAARSGKQNFVEGWEDGKSNSEMRLHLINVGKGSLQELREDYEDYLRQHEQLQWHKEHPRYAALVDFCKERNDVADYADVWQKMNDEELANMALTLLHQIDRMADGFLRRLEADIQAGISTHGVQMEMRNARKRASRGY